MLLARNKQTVNPRRSISNQTWEAVTLHWQPIQEISVTGQIFQVGFLRHDLEIYPFTPFYFIRKFQPQTWEVVTLHWQPILEISVTGQVGFLHHDLEIYPFTPFYFIRKFQPQTWEVISRRRRPIRGVRAARRRRPGEAPTRWSPAPGDRSRPGGSGCVRGVSSSGGSAEGTSELYLQSQVTEQFVLLLFLLQLFVNLLISCIITIRALPAVTGYRTVRTSLVIIAAIC